MQYRVLQVNNRYYPQHRYPWWPFWLNSPGFEVQHDGPCFFGSAVLAARWVQKMYPTKLEVQVRVWRIEECTPEYQQILRDLDG